MSETFASIESYIMKFPGAWKDFPFGEDVAAYKVGDAPGKLFALIAIDSKPLRLSLKCDPQLAETLRERYESVLPGYHLNKKHWITVICSGQLAADEIEDLIRLSYQLVTDPSR